MNSVFFCFEKNVFMTRDKINMSFLYPKYVILIQSYVKKYMKHIFYSFQGNGIADDLNVGSLRLS